MPTLQLPVWALVIWGLGAMGATALMWRAIFDGLDDFWECVKFWLKPDWWALFEGRWVEDVVGELRLALWLIGSVVLGAAMLWGMNQLVL